MMRNKWFVASVLCSFALGSCGGPAEEPAPSTEDVAGAKSAIFTLMTHLPSATMDRPSGVLGIFSSLYLAQGMFLPAQSALQGVGAQLALLRGHATPTADETFSLLQEFGSVLQVDIMEILNRSEDRAAALDQYVKTLTDLETLAKQKVTELETSYDEQKTKAREEKSAVQDIERDIRRALQDEDYGTAGAKQQLLTEAEGRSAKAESQVDQTKDILDTFEKLLEVSENRLHAIASNREVIIAGLKVVDVPGIEELDILDVGSGRRRDGGLIDM